MVGRDPYNLPQNTEREVDQNTFNPRAEASSDNAEYRPEIDDARQPVGARGADNQPTFRDYTREDMETERSDATGKIPKGEQIRCAATVAALTVREGEVDDLLSSAPDDAKGVSGRTRGAKIDAWKGDKEVDQFMQNSGLADAEQDVEIGRATGRG